MKFIGIIPARYSSTRFPGKPLIKIGDKTMVQHVYDQASKVLDTVVVATDDKRIEDEVHRFGGKAVMTSTEHKTGTDRLVEALDNMSQYLAGYADTEIVILNIQGDEPFINPAQLEALIACFDSNTQIATLVKPIDDNDELLNPNRPKVVFDINHTALYFSRFAIPYQRSYPENEWLNNHTFYMHIGIYAYRLDILRKIVLLEQSPLELAESLEQNRWLENGYKIKVAITNHNSYAIDTEDDLIYVLNHFETEL